MQKWREMYRRSYEDVQQELETDPNPDFDEVAQENIRQALRDNELDIMLVVSPEAGDTEDDDARESDEEGEKQVETEKGNRTLADEDENEGVAGEYDDDEFRIPKVPVWYRNAIMRDLWLNATASQQAAVEQHKKNEAEGVVEEIDDGMNDDEKQAKRLQGIIRLV